ncbi:TRAP transporter large permease [Ketogulonicigenium vulgare]|uniref:TRAP transporter large permease protein n=1 Tax=Ketogulonicigenium vulgare (strain WSH-001) TaxID=759362 RepID=F9Y7Y9_KETVW|nr:TRAP transporter large permease [Ketogulonicigenium vulgare]ADO42928.1 Sialic acid TRAP transporter permease protein siaT [Ketogulonicigenium vulgare Y25]AEM41115.1 C4-dicarboxylate transport system permease large protein [Ketogulonicigenium vulgare WSH-001]ALJ81254.1 C4-dicarboxylate ABC transporter permease [Ketogulonicigenium vulgare]ANW33995.1 C4-dicarboxylate ABC transporter permease [Ketogulonicigenium vulgare]
MAMLFVYLVMLFFAAVPIALALGIAPLPALMARNIPLQMVPQAIFESLDSFALIALPFFILAGKLMDKASIADRLVELAHAMVNWFRGGLGGASVLATMLFSTVSGSSSATAAAVGGIVIPKMGKSGYPRPFAAAVVASAAELGIILPPSGAMIIYGVVTGASIKDMFLAGIIPGLMIGFSLFVLTAFISSRKKYGTAERLSIAEWAANVWQAYKRAFLSLFMPVIILGGIYTGLFTATESAVVAVIFALVLGMFVYRTIKIRDLPGIFWSSAISAAVVLSIVGFASVLAAALSLYQVPQKTAALIFSISRDPYVVLLLVNVLLLVIGMFLEAYAAIIILAPVLAPAMLLLGIDPIHFGIIMIVNLAIGMVTPPVGVNLFITCSIARISLEQILRPLVAFVAVLLVNLMLITYVPLLLK